MQWYHLLNEELDLLKMLCRVEWVFQHNHSITAHMAETGLIEGFERSESWNKECWRITEKGTLEIEVYFSAMRKLSEAVT